MSRTDLEGPPDVGTILWEADRVTPLDLTDDQRRLFERAADWLAQVWPDESDEILDAAAELVDVQAEASNLRTMLQEIAEKIGLAGELATAQAVEAALERARAEGEKDATIPSRANTAERKAMRLVLERRVTIDRRDGQLVVATVKGDSATYRTGYDPNRPGRWRCTCPELRGECSHVQAVKMVVL